MKTRFSNEHVYETTLDLGVIGEQKVEVFYEWCDCRVSNDQFRAPEPDGAIVIAVLVFIDGKEIDITEMLNPNLLQDLEYECSEDYRG